MSVSDIWLPYVKVIIVRRASGYLSAFALGNGGQGRNILAKRCLTSVDSAIRAAKNRLNIKYRIKEIEFEDKTA